MSTSRDPQQRLNALWRRGTELLGTKYAILGGAMSWISERNLVSAISNAGGFGVIACGGMNPEQLKAEIRATREMTDKPFGVNLVVLHPDIADIVTACAEEKVSHVVFAGGLPTKDFMGEVKEVGGKVLCLAPTVAIAKRLIRNGADAIIIEGMEAGGHIGAVATGVLAQEMLPELPEVPVFVAGGIGRGEALTMYLEMGAAGVQLGTRFVVAEECIAHPDFKKAFIRASSRDATPSVQLDPRFPVIPVRALTNKATVEFMEVQRQVIKRYNSGELDKGAAQLEIELYWSGALQRAVIEGDVDTGSLMAGQSVGLIKKEQPCAEIVEELIAQALASLGREIVAA